MTKKKATQGSCTKPDPLPLWSLPDKAKTDFERIVTNKDDDYKVDHTFTADLCPKVDKAKSEI